MTTLVKRLLRASTRCPVTGRKLTSNAAAATSRPVHPTIGKSDTDAYATDWTSSVLSTDNFR